MLIFRRIFNFEKAKVDLLEKRLAQRFWPGPAFPLRVTLRSAGRELTEKILDISSNGIGLLIENDADLSVDQFIRVDVLLDQHRLQIDGRLAHLEPREKRVYLGIGLKFGDFSLKKSYLQLLQPVVIGQSLQLMAAERVIQDDPQFIKRIYNGDSDSLLTVRLKTTPGMPLHSFEFQMLDTFCRGTFSQGAPDAYPLESMDPAGIRPGHPVFESSGGLHAEILQLFRWILPNLSLAVPEDVRSFLQRFAS